MRKIALYGKGGIGKSTTCANLSAALAKQGYKVLQIGCDPKHDSCRTLVGSLIPTVLSEWANYANSIDINKILVEGYCGVHCVEAGGPEPGKGCAGLGIEKTIDILDELEVWNNLYDFVLFDVLGDVVCGGFAKPIKYADEVFIITSGEFMSLYAANNIAKSIIKFDNVCLDGIILNERSVPFEHEIIELFCNTINVDFTFSIPRDNIIGYFERKGMTVVQGNPECQQSKKYFELADKIIHDSTQHRNPIPVELNELQNLFDSFDIGEKTERKICKCQTGI